MSKQSHESRKIRSQSRLVTFARPVSEGRKPLAFDHQLQATRRLATASNPSRIESLCARLIQSIQRLYGRLSKRRGRRRKLDLLEIQQLGEKRFVAILRVGKQKFLIAGAATSISVLAEIKAQRDSAVVPQPPRQEGA